MGFFYFILNLIFPNYCIFCHKKGEYLCSECISKISKYNPNKLNNPPDTSVWIFSIFNYKDPIIRTAIKYLKYKRKKSLATNLAPLLYQKIIEESSKPKNHNFFINPLLVPIPISKKRYRERGFNQSIIICKELLRINKKQTFKKIENFSMEKRVLFKKIETKHQTRTKNKQERLKNISGTFAIKNPEKIKNRNIILIDDVTTTGATLFEAKKVLESSGASNVKAFTVAH